MGNPLIPARHLAIMALSVAMSLMYSRAAFADSFTFNANGTIGGEAASATATFDVNGDAVTLSLTNLIDSPNSVKSLLSGISFNTSSGSTGSSLLGTGQIIDVASDGSISLGGTNVTNWAFVDASVLQNDTDGFSLSILGSGQPEQGLIGNGPYPTNGSGGISGNDPHNPFVQKNVTFTFTIAGLNGGSISGVDFYFNTDGSKLTGTCSEGCGTPPPPPPPSVPEPGTFTLLGSGLLGLAGFMRKTSR